MKNLTLEERQIIEDLLRNQKSKREIARKLNRSHSSILDEIKRNKGVFGLYNAIEAHKKALYRKNNRNKRSKIEISPGLKEFIIKKTYIFSMVTRTNRSPFTYKIRRDCCNFS